MQINLSKQAFADELGEPALTQQVMCTADRVTAQPWSREVREAPKTHSLGQHGCSHFQPEGKTSVHGFHGIMGFPLDEEERLLHCLPFSFGICTFCRFSP